jgi:glycerol-3-phosphate dehydrogenase (NAD(P)+)
MNSDKKKIVILGAGTIGTAMGNSFSAREDLDVRLLSIEKDVVETITREHVNQKYFPNIRLHHGLQATTDERVLSGAEWIFLAIPSVAVIEYLKKLEPLIPSSVILINLAKGFGCDKALITECIAGHLENPVCTLKGPSFAREIINNMPTAFTLASQDEQAIRNTATLFPGTNLYVDFSMDLAGVEILSILKNIYAIVIGIVDAHFNSPNLRFLVFTKAFNEMRQILLHFGGKEETMFKYCGIGDFGLTSLNDLSRNRTLGLLIGKGFFTEDISGKVVLEGRIAMNIFLEKLRNHSVPEENYRFMHELERVFSGKNDITGFVNKLLS